MDVPSDHADKLPPGTELLRAAIALLLGALASVLGAFILGEYQFEGYLPIGAGLLFGLVVGELVVELGKRRTAPVALLAGLTLVLGAFAVVSDRLRDVR